MLKPIIALAGAVCVIANHAAAQEAPASNKPEEEKWDVAAPPMETREVSIDVDEGTWMNIDVSPDGGTIAFDLLGDIYTMPIAGGAATRIAEGLPFEMQPRFSPDGSMIAFTSDRAGGDNIWIMNADGSDKRQITKEDFRLLNSPSWSADGRYIAARKHFTTGRSLGTGEIWLYHLGGGDGVKLVKRPDEQHQKELGEPVFTPDGGAIYYTRNTTPGGTFIYAQDSNDEVFAIERYDLATGETDTIVGGAGGAVRPEPSPDGRLIAFVRRERGKSKLYIKNLASGAITKIYDNLDQDMQETWGVHGLYPTMAWTPDSQSIVFWAGGKIWRVGVNGGDAAEIPFRVTDSRDVIDPPRPQVDVAPDSFKTKMPRFASLSPDGRLAVFETLGKLYVKTMPDGTPRRLTNNLSADLELFPSWSRDSRRIVFVQWSDQNLGLIRYVSPNGGGVTSVTREPGHYRRPRISPNGRTIVYEKGAGGYLLSDKWSETTGVYRISIAGGENARVSRDGSAPHFGADSDRVFMTVSEDNAQKLISTDLNGEARRDHASGELVSGYQVSPDGTHMAFTQNYSVYAMPMTPGPQEVGAGIGATGLPLTKASGDGALYAHWSDNGKQLNWSLGPQLFSSRLNDMIPALPKVESDSDEEESEAGYEPPVAGVSLSIDVPSAKPAGQIALSGARIITMNGEDGGVIEDGVIVIDANRITAIGPRADVTVPAGAAVVDVAGKTITPGFIDAHAHGSQGDDDIVPQQNWLAIAHLALGVTTVHDPSNVASEVFAAAERQRAGQYLGPRIYSTGEIVYGAKAPGYYAEIDSYEDALAHVRRLKKQGAHSIKNYNQPRRNQRQMVVAAAKEEDIAVVAEGGSLFTMDMTIIADGNTALEHNIPQAKLYDDVLSFYGATEVAYTPTLVVTYGGLAGDPYWRYATDVWTHPILSKHVPPHILQPASVRRVKAPEEDYVDQVAAAAAKDLADRGVMVSIGAHGQEEGLASHWEMWSFARGGMSALEVLRTATTTPAKALGFDQDIGSLEAGKLADLVIMNENPLENIRNTDKIDKVMINGRLYDAATMNEVETGDSARRPYYWE